MKIKKALKLILFLVLVVIVASVSMFIYYGGLKSIDLQVEYTGGDTLVYTEVVGNYSKCVAAMDSMYLVLTSKENIDVNKVFAIYYHNPKYVDKDSLHTDVGCVIENADSTIMAELSKNHKIKIFPKEDYITTQFPYRGRVSIIVGVIKVYTAMKSYARKHNINGTGYAMEIYDFQKKKIIYRKKIVKMPN